MYDRMMTIYRAKAAMGAGYDDMFGGVIRGGPKDTDAARAIRSRKAQQRAQSNPWVQFVQQYKGQGYSFSELGDMYRAQHPGMVPGKKKPRKTFGPTKAELARQRLSGVQGFDRDAYRQLSSYKRSRVGLRFQNRSENWTCNKPNTKGIYMLDSGYNCIRKLLNPGRRQRSPTPSRIAMLEEPRGRSRSRSTSRISSPEEPRGRTRSKSVSRIPLPKEFGVDAPKLPARTATTEVNRCINDVTHAIQTNQSIPLSGNVIKSWPLLIKLLFHALTNQVFIDKSNEALQVVLQQNPDLSLGDSVATAIVYTYKFGGCKIDKNEFIQLYRIFEADYNETQDLGTSLNNIKKNLI